VADHFLRMEVWLNIIEYIQVKDHSSAAIVKKSSHHPVIVQNIHEEFIPNVFKFVTINSFMTLAHKQ